MARAYEQPSRGLVTQAASAMIARPDVPRSTFRNQWMRKTTFDAGWLVPFLVEEVYPGDDMTYKLSAYVRMGTPLFPMFSNFKIETFFFFVPWRLTWVNFTKMMGEQASPGDTIAYTVPTGPSPAGGFAVGSLQDHFGIPTVGQIAGGAVHDHFLGPSRGYYLIWNQWFRDENSVNGLNVPLVDTTTEAGYTLQRRMKVSDRFTRALPWPQKFTAPAALGTQAPVVGLGVNSPAANIAGGALVGTPATSQPGGLFTPSFMSNQVLIASATAAGNTPLAVYADLSAITINTLRLSFLVQEMLERDARGGTRYVELMQSHFGVMSPDARLQRPEYIGGGSSPLILSPIAQDAPGGSGLGSLGAVGAGFGQHSARYACVEHGMIMGIINVQSELAYQQGMPRLFSHRRTRFDFYWPSLAGLGEQPVYRGEIYKTGVPANDDTIFGYQPSWEELRQRESEVVGLFRSTAASNIDEWGTWEQFGSAPVLGQTFLQDNPPMSRILAAGASTNQQFLGDLLIERIATRPLPVHGTPTTLGRF